MILGFVGSAKGNACVAGSAYKLAIRRHRLYIGDCLANRYGNDVTSLERDHYPTFPFHQGSHRTRSVIRRQHAIKSVRSAAALQMSQHHAASFFAAKFFEFSLTMSADSTKPRRMLVVTTVLVNQFMPRFTRSFCSNASRPVSSVV